MIKKGKSQTSKGMMVRKRKRNKLSNYVGVEAVFYNQANRASYDVFKKSTAVKIGPNFFLKANETLKKSASKLGMRYAGISDLYSIGGKPEHGIFLGRTAYYNLDRQAKAKALLAKLDYDQMKSWPSTLFFVSLVYFIKSDSAVNGFTILFNLGIEATGRSLRNQILKIASSKNVKNLISSTSLDISKGSKIDFIGVNWVERIDQKLPLFNTAQARVRSRTAIQKEIERKTNLERKLKRIIENNAELST